MGLLTWLFGEPNRASTVRAEPIQPSPRISKEEAYRLDAEWQAEWLKNTMAAIEALPERDPMFKVECTKDGWWRVMQRSHHVGQPFYRGFWAFMEPILASSWDEGAHELYTKARVYRTYDPFEPKFLTRLEAEQWLSDYIEAQDADATSIPYNADGSRATIPQIANDVGDDQ